MASKKASGFVTEDERHTERLTLRLDPEAMEILNGYAKDLGWTKARVVEMALESFKNDKLTQKMMHDRKVATGE